VTRPSRPETGATARSLTSHTISSVSWLGLLQVATIAMQLCFLASVSRLLDPASFGTFAIAGIVLRLVSYLADLGLGAALVQAPRLTPLMIRQAHGACIAAGLALTGVVLAIAKPLASLTHQKGAVGVTAALACVFVLDAFGTTPSSMLRRRHDFRRIALAEGVSYAVGFLAVGIPCAALGLGAYSLVAASLVQTTTRSVLLLTLAGGPHVPALPTKDMAGLLRFGTAVSGIGFLEFWSSNLDSAMVGRVGGATQLGEYNRASSLVGLPLQYLGQTITRALLPAFARGSVLQVRRGLDYGLSLLSAACIPVLALASVAAHPLVTTVLGPRWRTAADILPIVCVAVLFNTLTQVPAVACEGQGLLRQKASIQMVHMSIVIGGLAIAVAIKAGLFAFALVWLSGEVVRHVGYLALIRARFGVTLRSLGQSYGSACAIAVPAATAAIAVCHVLSGVAALAVVVIVCPLLLLGTVATRPAWPVRRATRQLHLTDRLPLRQARPLIERLVA
jgi:O-antigen/teichoic acid export membrane protein